jgi:hypothetical protein
MYSLSRPSTASFCTARSVRSGTPRRIGHRETMKPTSRLTLDFAQRMIADLSTNNVLRGAWAEHLVAHFISITDLPPNWSYYDMRDVTDRVLSVKHSVGPKPTFAVSMLECHGFPGQ